jgi:hypothetical protein
MPQHEVGTHAYTQHQYPYTYFQKVHICEGRWQNFFLLKTHFYFIRFDRCHVHMHKLVHVDFREPTLHGLSARLGYELVWVVSMHTNTLKLVYVNTLDFFHISAYMFMHTTTHTHAYQHAPQARQTPYNYPLYSHTPPTDLMSHVGVITLLQKLSEPILLGLSVRLG